MSSSRSAVASRAAFRAARAADSALDGVGTPVADVAAALVDAAVPAIHHPDLGAAALHALDLFFQFLGLPDIIGVQRRDVDAPRRPDGGVAGAADTGITLPDEPKARIGGDELLDDGAGRVGRSVVDDDLFEIAVLLSLDGLKRRADIGLGVVRRDNDRN